jgi:hypothetical protein
MRVVAWLIFVLLVAVAATFAAMQLGFPTWGAIITGVVIGLLGGLRFLVPSVFDDW